MKSKKSFFNKTMFWKDIIRLWPLWVIGVLITLFAFAVPFLTGSVEVLQYGDLILERLDLDSVKILNEIRLSITVNTVTSSDYLILMAVMAIICAVLVFQYLNRQCSSYMLHSLPVSRKTMYVTHYLSGFFMYIVPYLLLWCVLGCLNVLFGIHMGAAILGYVLETLMIALFFYSLACFVVMLSSSSIMSLFIYAVINVMVYVFFYLVEAVIDLFTYGTGSYFAGGFEWKGLVTIFTPGEYFSNALEIQGCYDNTNAVRLYAEDGLPIGDFHYGSVFLCLMYVIPAIVLFVTALLLYQRRKLERVDENLVFLRSKVIYRVVFCCCGSYTFAWLMYYLTYGIFSHLVTYQYAFLIATFYLLIGAVLCYLICDMILAKSFFIWKRLSYLQMGVITAGIILVFLAGHHAYLRHSTVDTSQVMSVDVDFHDEIFHITQKERVDALLAYQKKIIKQGNQKLMYDADNREETDSRLDEEEYSYCDMAFNYKMKNKGEMYRYYHIQTKEDKLLTDIILYLNDTEYLVGTAFPEDFNTESIKRIYYNGEIIVNRKEMYDAMMKDLQDGHIVFGNIYKKNQSGFVDCGRRIGSFRFEYETTVSEESSTNQYRENPFYDDDDYDYYDDDYYDEFKSLYFDITDECTHVLNALEQAGIEY